MSEKYVLIGEINEIKEKIKSFDGIDKYIDYFISGDSSVTLFDKKVYGLDIISDLDDNKSKFVFFNCKYRKKYYNFISQNYDIDSENLLTASEWIVSLLKDKKIIIKPLELRVDICTSCQLNCPGCYVRLLNFGILGNGYMKFSEYKKLLDDNPYIREIELSNNGESLLNPDLIEILKYSYEKNVKVKFINGVNFNFASDALLEALVKYQVKELVFSIDGATNEVYKIYRRNGDLDKVFDNINKLNYYKEKYDSSAPIMTYKFILMDHNEHEIEKAIEVAEKLKCNIYFRPDYRGFHPKNPNKVLELTGIGVDSNTYESEQSVNNFCLDMINSPQINWDGRLLGCCKAILMDFKENIFDVGLINALNSDYYKHAIYNILGDKTVYEENQCNRECDTYYTIKDLGKYVDL